MKLFKVQPGTETPLKLYDIKKRKEAKELLIKFPTLFYKSFGKARKALAQPIRDTIAKLKGDLKLARKVKKKELKPITLSKVEKMKGYDKLAEAAALVPAVKLAEKKVKKEKKSKKTKRKK